jgi:hypothetical protein
MTIALVSTNSKTANATQKQYLEQHGAKVVQQTKQSFFCSKLPRLEHTTDTLTHIVMAGDDTIPVPRRDLGWLGPVSENIPFALSYEWVVACVVGEKLAAVDDYKVELLTDAEPAPKKQRTEEGGEAAAGAAGAAAAEAWPAPVGATPLDVVAACPLVDVGDFKGEVVFGEWCRYRTMMFKFNDPHTAPVDTASSSSSSASSSSRLRLLALDMDWNVIKPKSGKTFPVNEKDWTWWDLKVSETKHHTPRSYR